MPQTYSQLHFHIVFGTKDRTPAIDAAWRERLWRYVGGIVKGERGIPLQVGGTADHLHLLVTLSPTHSTPAFLQKLKSHSSAWVHEQFPNAGMWWQPGYGAFSVSHSALADVDHYIRNQEEHHKTMTFEDEYRALLTRHGIEFDERYLWG